MHTIGRLAEMAGVTTRTLRHYDRIGLLRPTGRTDTGYRQYTPDDVILLQQVLFYRELEFTLAQIRQLMQAPEYDRNTALRRQAGMLELRAGRFAELARTARRTLAAIEEGQSMEEKEMFDGFDYDRMMDEQKRHEPEVRERWGDTEAYRVSKERTSRYTKEDWEKISKKQGESLQELAVLYQSGALPEDPRVQQIVRQARLFIDETFYPCSWEMFRGLGEMVAADPRFAATYDKLAEGLSGFYSEAVRIACDAGLAAGQSG